MAIPVNNEDVASLSLWFEVLLGVAGLLGGFVLNALWNAVKELREDIAQMQKDRTEVQKHIAETYLRRDDFRDHTRRVEDALARIEILLQNKADK